MLTHCTDEKVCSLQLPGSLAECLSTECGQGNGSITPQCPGFPRNANDIAFMKGAKDQYCV